MDSILASIKSLLGIPSADTSFDNELVININSVFSLLYQLGVGPNAGFSITGSTETWTTFLSNETALQLVKSYVFLKVKMMFDPPQNSSYLKTMEEMCREYEWRLNVFSHSEKHSQTN